jgi:hypothetical protein
MGRMREDRRLALRRRVFNEIAIDGNAAEPGLYENQGATHINNYSIALDPRKVIPTAPGPI